MTKRPFVYGPTGLQYSIQPNQQHSNTDAKEENPMDIPTCTCSMEFQSVSNDLHDEACDLWDEPSFRNGEDEWDPDLYSLVLSMSPWHRIGDYEWQEGEPVITKTEAGNRSSVHPTQQLAADWVKNNRPVSIAERVAAERQAFSDALIANDPAADNLSELEIEALLASQSEDPDSLGFLALGDGSYCDFEQRVTYRMSKDENDTPYWTEMYWDDEDDSIDQDDTPAPTCTCAQPKKFYCHVCKVQRETEQSEWYAWEPGKATKAIAAHTPGYSTASYYNGCGHKFETFKLPKRQNNNIRISGSRIHTPETTPDFGLYASNCWNPKCAATFIPWTDYGLPTCSFKTAALSIVDVFNKAEAGYIVEVGCMGGHGRTGTILACLAILSDADMTPKQAISWARTVHCNKAVETAKQEWFVEWFASWHRGTECPPEPVTTVTYTAVPNWQAAQSSVPKAPLTSPYAGTHTDGEGWRSDQGKWCVDCRRIVWTQHNAGCPTERASFTPVYVPGALDMTKYSTPLNPGLSTDVDKATDRAVTALMPKAEGATPNARRRNAKRANRRAAQRRRAQRMAAQNKESMNE